MMRKVLVAAVAVGMVALAGCSSAPNPRNNGKPVIQSVVVTSNPVVAGGQLTATITATDDIGVLSFTAYWADTSESAELLMTDRCDFSPIDLADNRLVVVDMTCDVPAIASNGEWRLAFSVRDNFPGDSTSGRVTFNVTGGTSDYSKPVVNATAVPAHPGVGEAFHMLTVIEDETGPISGYRGIMSTTISLVNGDSQNPRQIHCTVSRSQLTSTSWLWDYACDPTLGQVAAGVFTAQIFYADGLNQITAYNHSITIG